MMSGLSSCGGRGEKGAAPARLAPFCDGELTPTQAGQPPVGPLHPS